MTDGKQLQDQLTQSLRRVLMILRGSSGEVGASRSNLERIGAARGPEIAAANAALDDAERAIQQCSLLLQQELACYAEGLEWEVVNIALYGETNAGKSALVEALTRGDGSSVGDGRKDHTQQLRRARSGVLVLMDTPGIEGREGALLVCIEQALAQAHVVLFVLADKEPEEGTLRKLQRHLNRASHIFSVLNKRGRPSAYRHRSDLSDSDTERQRARIEDKMRRVFGQAYKGHLLVQAHLALLSHGAMLEQRFLPDQRKAVQVFDSLEKARTFSGVHALEEVLLRSSRDARAIILSANRQRVIATLGDVAAALQGARTALSRAADLWRGVMDEVRPAITRRLTMTRRTIELRLDADLAALATSLKLVLHPAIEESRPESSVQAEIREQARVAATRMNIRLRQDLDAMERDLREQVEQIQARLQLHIRIDLSLQDFGKILTGLARQVLGEVLDVVLSLVGSGAAWLLNPILGAAALIVSGLRKLWEYFGGGRERRLREARARANAAVDEVIAKLRREQITVLDREWRRLTQEVEAQLSAIAAAGSGLLESADSLQRRLKSITEERTWLDGLFIAALAEPALEKP